MSEDNFEEIKEQLQDAIEGVDEAPEVLEHNEAPKQERKERKHMSQEEWEAAGRDPAKYKDKQTFDKDGSFFEKIESQTKYIKNLEGKLKKLEQRAHMEEQAAYENLRHNYTFERDQAILNSRLDKYHEAEYKLNSLRAPDPIEQEPDEYIAEVANIDRDFMEKNKSWWNYDSIENIQMVSEASELAEELKPLLFNGSISERRLVNLVEDHMAKKYPHKFEDDYSTEDAIQNVKEEINSLREEMTRPRAASVETNSIPRSKFTDKDLPSSIREIYVEAKRGGYTNKTAKQYYDEYKKAGGRD